MRQKQESSRRQSTPSEASVIPLPTRPVDRYSTRKRNYLPVRVKFTIAIGAAAAWVVLCVWLAEPWADALADLVGVIAAWVIIAGIALIPGFMNAFLLISLAMDNRPAQSALTQYPGVSILVAAYNEQDNIVSTIESIAQQHYPGALEVIVVNDGSRDNTAELVKQQLPHHAWLRLLDLPKNIGKARALNEALTQVSHAITITVDADSWLFRDALQSIVERYTQDPPSTRAVAGGVMVRNSRETWMTRAQEWDYFQGIAAIKRVQSLYQGTMVAQGAFSLYDTATLREIGGWPDCIGEDIVLSWSILKAGHRIGYCEDALLFTNAPTTLLQFARQRKRWSRGMIEAFKQHPDILLLRALPITFVYWNLLFPFLDLIFTFVFIPGIVLALFGYFWIVGPITLALIPMAMGMNYFMYRIGCRMFERLGLRVRFNVSGFFIYSLFYSLIMQPVSLAGYIAEVLNLRKSWGTK
ncbi:MAG: glycosyltransferase family 2 protein [Oxalobacteraceae bacterium]|nr:glycosyltransferase family 2 protein [Oxalobacteraceae bacterium]